MARKNSVAEAPGGAIPPVVAPITIEALGRWLAEVRIARDRHDALQAAHQGDIDENEAAMTVLNGISGALEDLLTYLPPVSIADVAVQLDVAGVIACDLAANNELGIATVRVSAEKLERIAFAAVPIIAAAAGLDIATMDFGQSVSLRDARFAGAVAGSVEA